MPESKTLSLLRFLQGIAALRQKRFTKYSDDDKVLYFGELPTDEKHIKSPFVALPVDSSDAPPWLIVQKAKMPPLPPLPAKLRQWIVDDALADPASEPKLPTEISSVTSLSGDGDGEVFTLTIDDHPDVVNAWEAYLTESWRPWAVQKKHWEELQETYNELDEMRREQEDGGDRTELLLAFGLLQWHTDAETIERHMFVAPAEITLHASRGRLTVEPSVAFERFRLETDMLPASDVPDVDVDQELSALDIAAWSKELVGPLLRKVANAWRANTQADADEMLRARGTGHIPRLVFAPALVMRKRRSSAYSDVLKQLQEAVDGDTHASAAPWDALLDEGANAGPGEVSGEVPPLPNSGDYNFPLPANEAQREILDRLRVNAGVLVKGPPGTGKSHTIANLICHLLSEGHRILVTAHAPKALAVLRDLLPKEMQNLCVTMMGGSREDQRILEDGVSTILAKHATWNTEKFKSPIEVSRLERRIADMRREQEIAEHKLRECREAETLTLDLPGGYVGTRGTVARKVAADAERFAWFPFASLLAKECPLDADELHRVARAGRDFPPEIATQLTQYLGSLKLPTPGQFATLCHTLSEGSQASGAHPKVTEVFAKHSDEALTALRDRLVVIQEHAANAQRALGTLADQVVSDALANNVTKWGNLATRAVSLLERHDELVELVEGLHFDLPDLGPPEMARLADDIDRRRAHFESLGRRGWWLFAPRVVRETAVVEKTCRINGRSVRDVTDLIALSSYMQLRKTQKRLEDAWPVPVAIDGSLSQRLSRWDELAVALKVLVDGIAPVLKEWGPLRGNLPLEAFAAAKARLAWQQAIDSELNRRKVVRFQGLHNQLLVHVNQELATADAHPSLHALAQAVAQKDAAAFAKAHAQREHALKKRAAFNLYMAALEKLERTCPGLGQLLRENMYDEAWSNKAKSLPSTWHWAVARREVAGEAAADPVQALTDRIHRLQEQREEATSALVALKSWGHFFSRLDAGVRANLIAWQGTIRRIGQGTGRNANMHRRQARAYLSECIPAIPVWVMPLHKLWDTVRAAPGLFDTIIVDEASQAGLDALPLLMLGKRIVVVGDDMQNSPEAVGVNENDVQRLIAQHLNDLHFRSTFIPTSSLFDHAYRTFSSQVTLREHFRCAPEIIRFSNRFYNPPLLPLRQLPAARSRIPALKTTFVEGGTSEGSNAFIRNDAEADAIVAAIQSILRDRQYENKTIGVIAMQGRYQAERIARKLAAVLTPDVIEERRLRCGESASFQGDQRDVMLLSLVVGPNQNYLARTTLPDQRRYNVAMSRARDQVWLFHSVRPSDLSPSDLRYHLLQFFQQPNVHPEQQLDTEALRRAASGPRELGSAPAPFESWFELDVWLALVDRGFFVQPQVEVAHYRIDLVVEGSSSRLAVECDGEHWHGPDQYASDMARQRQLERANWTFTRVREAAFYADREAALALVLEKCDELGIEPWGATTGAEDSAPYNLVSEVESSHASVPSDDGDAIPGGEAWGSDDEEETYAEDSIGDDDVPEERDESIPFSGYSKANAFPDPRVAAPANVRESVAEIIRQDGPLMYSSVYRLYAEACPAFRRCGKAVKSKLNQAIAALLRAGVITRETEIDRLPDESRVLRLTDAPRWRGRPSGKRDILEIPPLEMMAALDERRQSHDSPDTVTDRDWATMLLELYEGQRMTRARESYLFAVVNSWKQRQAVV